MSQVDNVFSNNKSILLEINNLIRDEDEQDFFDLKEPQVNRLAGLFFGADADHAAEALVEGVYTNELNSCIRRNMTGIGFICDDAETCHFTCCSCSGVDCNKGKLRFGRDI